ncbi:DUF4190 domain-containing protein [Microbispora amethystogenes]|uniref:DUF4190 domain-containing protein n=1 Tax=Microbispora amethystogenes TaxID=1427754 RepID=UPI00340BF9A5
MSHGYLPGDSGGHGHPPGAGGVPPVSGYGHGYGNGYGYPPPPPPYGYQQPHGPRTNGMAVASLVLGVLGLLFCGVPGIAGVICGHVALNQTRRTGEQGRGLAIAGLILSYAGAAVWILYAIGLGLLAALSVSHVAG